jgi:hypothetical protein
MLDVIYAECHIQAGNYAECHYAECRYAECRGAISREVHMGPRSKVLVACE